MSPPRRPEESLTSAASMIAVSTPTDQRGSDGHHWAGRRSRLAGLTARWRGPVPAGHPGTAPGAGGLGAGQRAHSRWRDGADDPRRRSAGRSRPAVRAGHRRDRL